MSVSTFAGLRSEAAVYGDWLRHTRPERTRNDNPKRGENQGRRRTWLTFGLQSCGENISTDLRLGRTYVFVPAVPSRRESTLGRKARYLWSDINGATPASAVPIRDA